ncbi:hypothetical protein ACE6H2_006787 [Prunus campanulata]
MMVKISSLHPRSTLANSILDKGGSRGNSAIFLPNLVSSPSSSSAPKLYNCSMVEMSARGEGGSIKSKDKRSFIPIAFIVSVVVPRFILWIYGIEVGDISLRYALSV